MARFQLDPNKSAMENLFDAARVATAVIGRSHRWWHLHGEYFGELFDRILLGTVLSFMEHKVRLHKYARVSKDGRKLCFFDNVLSSCWATSSNVVDDFIKEIDRRNRTSDVEPIKFALTYADRMPIYLNRNDILSKCGKARKYSDLLRGCDRAERARELYGRYLAEAELMGLQNVLEFGPWLSRNGYTEDEELMWALEPKEVKRSMLKERDRVMKESALSEEELHRRIYMRKWAKKYREKKAAELSSEYEKLYGPPPAGWEYYKYGDIVAIRRRRMKENA